MFFPFFFNWFFFLNFILQHWVDWELSFVICFDMLSMRLFQSHDSSHKFGGLTLVDPSSFLYPFLINFFLYFVFQHFVDKKMSFIFFFLILLSIRLSFFHDSGRGFGKLTRVNMSYFFGSFFNWFFLVSSFNIEFIENLVS